MLCLALKLFQRCTQMSNNVWPPPIAHTNEDENDKEARLAAEREAKRIRYALILPVKQPRLPEPDARQR